MAANIGCTQILQQQSAEGACTAVDGAVTSRIACLSLQEVNNNMYKHADTLLLS
jgi:hypothetical protein